MHFDRLRCYGRYIRFCFVKETLSLLRRTFIPVDCRGSLFALLFSAVCLSRCGVDYRAVRVFHMDAKTHWKKVYATKCPLTISASCPTASLAGRSGREPT